MVAGTRSGGSRIDVLKLRGEFLDPDDPRVGPTLGLQVVYGRSSMGSVLVRSTYREENR